MPRSSSSAQLPRLLQADGLTTTLSTSDFSCWEAAVASSLGHHRSELLNPTDPFQAHFRVGELGGFGVLHLQGRGRVRLLREQCVRSVLWLPLCGMSAEVVNGKAFLAEPGQALLFRPGDALLGETSQELEGLSILLPPEIGGPSGRSAPTLLQQGPLQQALLRSARQLAAAAAQQPAGAEHAADRLSNALLALWSSQEHPPGQERITARRRREMVHAARAWMAQRLPERFTLQALSAAVGLSPHQLQDSFLEELGHAPMAEAKRLRLKRLRSLLLDPDQRGRSVAELMAASGLIASGVTSGDYRRWCGETPMQTRQRSRG